MLKRYEEWKDHLPISGPDGLKQIKGFREEALRLTPAPLLVEPKDSHRVLQPLTMQETRAGAVCIVGGGTSPAATALAALSLTTRNLQ